MKSGIVVPFGLASFVAAVLLFSVQPMIGKMVLPVLGGTPAVWNTCLIFFQMMLLCGYLLTHAVGSGPGTELRRVSVYYLGPIAVLPGVRLLPPADSDRARSRLAKFGRSESCADLARDSFRRGRLAAADGLGDCTLVQCLVCTHPPSQGP